MIYSADFETTTDVNDCRVWAWGLCEVGNEEKTFIHGNNLDCFMSVMARKYGTNIYYFHNAKFDSEFIITWLFKHGFKHVKYKRRLEAGEFTTLISDMRIFYSMEICFYNENKHVRIAKILDSYKIMPLSVEKLAQAFNLEIRKGSIDYNKKREIGYQLDENEISYLKNDVVIVSQALKHMFDLNLKKMTAGSNALFDYKQRFGKKQFEHHFPILDYDEEIRQSYKGAFVYVNPKFKCKEIGEGLVFDVNSLYPYVMRHRKFPYGEGIYFEGEYKQDAVYDLYVQMFSAQFELKTGYIPTIATKNDLAYKPLEYLESSGGEYMTLCLTNVDLDLMKEHYEIYDITYHGGWKFKSSSSLFNDYIDYWYHIKEQATKDKNGPLRQIAKFMLVNLYGKFSLNPNCATRSPFLNTEKDIICYKLNPPETREPIYIPVGTFVTSWARDYTIRSAQSLYDRFLYADTDSLHICGTEIPTEIEISDTKLGAWKCEAKFTRAKYLRNKCYIEDIIDEGLKVTCAGMPKECYQYVTWENFKFGTVFDGKLSAKHVPGGIVLVPTTFEIQE